MEHCSKSAKWVQNNDHWLYKSLSVSAHFVIFVLVLFHPSFQKHLAALQPQQSQRSNCALIYRQLSSTCTASEQGWSWHLVKNPSRLKQPYCTSEACKGRFLIVGSETEENSFCVIHKAACELHSEVFFRKHWCVKPKVWPKWLNFGESLKCVSALHLMVASDEQEDTLVVAGNPLLREVEDVDPNHCPVCAGLKLNLFFWPRKYLLPSFLQLGEISTPCKKLWSV